MISRITLWHLKCGEKHVLILLKISEDKFPIMRKNKFTLNLQLAEFRIKTVISTGQNNKEFSTDRQTSTHSTPYTLQYSRLSGQASYIKWRSNWILFFSKIISITLIFVKSSHLLHYFSNK